MGTKRRTANDRLPRANAGSAKNTDAQAIKRPVQEAEEDARGQEPDLKARTRRLIKKRKSALDKLASLD